MKKMIIAASALMVMAAANVQAGEGQTVYQQACFACHGTGAANAPKTGDKAAWKARIAKGMKTLNKHAVDGFKGDKGFMPAKGGRSDLSNAAVEAAVKYMVDQSK